MLRKEVLPLLLMSNATDDKYIDKCPLTRYFHHQQWDLVEGPELLPLLTMIRTRIGRWWLVDSSKTHAIFVRWSDKDPDTNEQVLLVYGGNVVEDHVSAAFHKEVRREYFFTGRSSQKWRKGSCDEDTLFKKTCARIRRRDQDCGRVLRSRRRLLGPFSSQSDDQPIEASIQR